jgi:hypothetical protein
MIGFALFNFHLAPTPHPPPSSVFQLLPVISIDIVVISFRAYVVSLS